MAPNSILVVLLWRPLPLWTIHIWNYLLNSKYICEILLEALH
jgi:hypothetical protein